MEKGDWYSSFLGRKRFQRREGKTEISSPEQEDHAWFVCFAPAKHPQIVVMVLVEHGGHGGATAAPVARKLLENFQGRGKITNPTQVKMAFKAASETQENR